MDFKELQEAMERVKASLPALAVNNDVQDEEPLVHVYALDSVDLYYANAKWITDTESGFLHIYNGGDEIATFAPGKWSWVEYE